MKKLFTKIIKKNPTKLKKISLLFLILSYFVFAFVTLIKIPLVGWITLFCGLFSVYLLSLSSLLEVEKQNEEFIDKMQFFVPTVKVGEEDVQKED